MEKLMQFVWQHRLAVRPGMRTVDGRPLTIVNQGRLNTDAGPDFFNASITLDGETWVGNIEIHVRASDWYRHKHDSDPTYDSVILHVVQHNDMEIKRRDGSVIPQITITCTPEAARRCNSLLAEASHDLPCRSTIASTPSIYRSDWLTALAMERLYRKSERILQLVKDTAGHWEGAAYITLARGLGFGLNSDPFEMLAKSMPLQFLNKHADEQLTVEALLIGQAGLIPPQTTDEHPYTTRIREEYTFMAHKFSLNRPRLLWKLARTRPQNFPYRRIAMLAALIHSGFYLVGKLNDCKSVEQLRELFSVELTGFWATHFTFDTHSTSARSAAISKDSIDTLLINVAVPLMHARRMTLQDFEGMQHSVELLQQLASESNSIVRLFAGAGLKSPDAFTSQALVELRREYCEKNKCIYCRFGHRMLSAEIARP
ncbi:MAG: DUF2851 family protein [Bacteroidales bacterium]|nr:DUF2851 family protein [Bacteroidales bacterium]